jgi:hypothetical protein
VKIEGIRIENVPLFAFQKAQKRGIDSTDMIRTADRKTESILFWDLVNPHKRKLYKFILNRARESLRKSLGEPNG